MEELARQAIEYLHAKRPFAQRLFVKPDADEAGIRERLRIDRQIFYETDSIQSTLQILDKIAASGSQKGCMIGLRANIEDGKTAFLNYLRYDDGRSFIPVLVEQDDDDDDEWRIIMHIVYPLLFEMKNREILEEDPFNQAALAFEDCEYNDTDPRPTIIRYLGEFKDRFRDRKILILCDDANREKSLRAFQRLLKLRTIRPPRERIFGRSLLVVVFTTREVQMEKVWESGNFEQSGYHFRQLKISADDMFNITRNILGVCFDGWNGAAPELATMREQNPVFPFKKKDLYLFLKNKAKKEVIRDADREVITEVAELQLRNMLNLLQEAIDKKAGAEAGGLIQTNDLIEIDLEPR